MSANQFGFRKTWSGGNGKYETVAGVKRSKWNNFSFTRSTKRTSGIAFKGRYKTSPTDPTWEAINYSITQAVPYTGSAVTWTALDELKLQGRLLDKVKGHSFNLAVSSAESNKTANLVVSTLSTLGRSAKALRHGDFSTAARLLGVNRPRNVRALEGKDVAGRWLELQYGWKPLVADVYEGVKAYHALTSKPRKVSFYASNWKGKDTPHPDRAYSTKSHRKLKKQILYEMSESMSGPRQLGLLDPLSVAWELFPFSFVVDWFVPIGSYLDALAQIPALKGRFMTTTTDHWYGYDTYMWGPDSEWPTPIGSGLSPIVEISQFPQCSAEWLQMDRVVSTSLSPPKPFSFDRKGLRNQRVWNAIALAHLAFTGPLQRASDSFLYKNRKVRK